MPLNKCKGSKKFFVPTGRCVALCGEGKKRVYTDLGNGKGKSKCVKREERESSSSSRERRSSSPPRRNCKGNKEFFIPTNRYSPPCPRGKREL